MWTHWLQGRKQAGTQLKRAWAAVGFPFSGNGFPHLKEPRDSGNPRETDVTRPTDWWSNSEPGAWGTRRVVQAPPGRADASAGSPSLGTGASRSLQWGGGTRRPAGGVCLSASRVNCREVGGEAEEVLFSKPRSCQHPSPNQTPPLAMCGERLCCSPSTPLGQATPGSYWPGVNTQHRCLWNWPRVVWRWLFCRQRLIIPESQ